MAGKKTKGKGMKKDMFLHFEDFKKKVSSLPQFSGMQISHLEFRDKDTELASLIDDLNSKIAPSGKELHSFTLAANDYCYCEDTDTYGPRSQCKHGNCL